jgi:cell division protein FtsN
MIDRDAESGRELVLDNRKLLVVFVVFLAICGIFFVLGFREGKRQGIQLGEQNAAETVSKSNTVDTQAQTLKPPATDTSTAANKEGSGEQPLDWYNNVNRKDGAPEIVHQTTTGGTIGEAKDAGISTKTGKTPINNPKGEDPSKRSTAETTAAAKAQKQASSPQPNPAFYSVQVGAFRSKSEAENKAKALRAQQYDCRIEDPQSPQSLYLLKVGKYKSRADAVAMRLRLKKSGIFSIIKTD